MGFRGQERITLDLFGISTITLGIQDGTPIPSVGDYICARCSPTDSAYELIGYDDIEAPGELIKVTLPVVQVNGSNVWLLANPDAGTAFAAYSARRVANEQGSSKEE